jgi:hypothetical protein
LKGEDSIASICRREGIAPSLYYKWSKTFLQAGKRRLDGFLVLLITNIIWISNFIDDLKSADQ